MNGFDQWLQQLQPEKLIIVLVIAVSSLLCISIHEMCHGLVAYWMGDTTAKRMGRLSLNPIKHIDIMGLIMMVIAGFGWAKPVPVNMQRFRHPKLGMAITAIAGPLSNVLWMMIAMIARDVTFHLYLENATAWLYYLCIFFQYTTLLSAGLAVFNLFPIPPLDGSKVLFALLPSGAYRFLMRYEKYGFILLAVLIFLDALGGPLTFLRDGLLDFSAAAVEPITEFVLLHI